MSRLSVEALELAVTALEEGLREYADYPVSTMRDGVIQRFEIAMDLAWKLLQRTLKDILAINPGLIRTKEDMFRVAAEYELITNTERWLAHYEARNQTSHIYDGNLAAQVFEHIPTFLPDVRELLTRLKDAA
uniref:Nucleotidyltransferase substrate binding protein, HI0074 family n=1 Tax=Candidatus Kentrum sp. TUN TaxID=2126343 RepID=A0A451A3C7_9GAMM|nr:MAG: nucleotidyltransferase substrate binding protein, HI0074 family [Candidatus Kentron sp. TUN]VFK62186.1 MAG: nucleotidyltransferase substrate binding protein, HI0074 family [Candidatus Kentron sp. TUN]VFK69824.1 MAG: nucleotidyltransferase substrate binding protein, HI0074 family [Candidatus Kentron sp. TUN]